ncbi:hypothetical protein IJ579_04885 [bacterium]|nr:hypothetical protein [bacterium]
MQVQRILSNKALLKGLEKISEHGTSFQAVTSLLMSLSVRPFAIYSTPDTEKENRQYAVSNSICSGLMKFAMVEAVALPVENAIKAIDKNPQKYINSETLKNLSPRAYKLLTQTMKLGVGFLTAVPKSMLTIALIPVVMDQLFSPKKTDKINKDNFQNNNNSQKPAFTGGLSKGISRIINNNKIQNWATKFETKDKDIPKHITAATDVLLTSTSVIQTKRSRGIEEDRKLALIYNNIISTGITIAGGYGVDSLIKSKTGKFIDQFKRINAGDPKLSKYVEGINILRPAIIFAAIYYGLLPMLSTYMGEKIDKYLNK